MLKAKGDKLTSGFETGLRQAVPCVQFDHPAVEREPVVEPETTIKESLGKVINAVCEWLYPKGCRQTTVSLRAYTFVWFMRPEWLGNPTQVELSKRLNVSKQTLGKVVNQLRNQFHFYVGGMRGDEARRKFAAHAKRRSKELAEARRRANSSR